MNVLFAEEITWPGAFMAVGMTLTISIVSLVVMYLIFKYDA